MTKATPILIAVLALSLVWACQTAPSPTSKSQEALRSTDAAQPAALFEAQESPPATAQRTPGQEPAPEGVEVLSIDPNTSTVRFTGEREGASHSRIFARFGGEVHVDEGKPLGVWVVLDVKSLVHGNDALSHHVLSPDFLNVKAHPTAGFRSSKLVPVESSEHTHQVFGTIEIRGTQHEVNFPATLSLTEDGFHGEGILVLNRKDFGIQFPALGNDPIRDEVPLYLVINAPR
ncbi:MAG: YceI family protein [Myxococcota bacterium]